MSNLKNILSIDGGGIRGIIPGQIMVEIEKAFKIKVSDYFDLMTGTSTGGILACAYLCPDDKDPTKPKFNAEQVVGLYFKKGEEIFDLPLFHKIRTVDGLLDEKYPDDGIDDALHEYFGNVWLKDILKPCLITSYDITRRKGHFFSQHKAAVNTEYNFKLRDVARATSSAPTYFECPKISSETGESFTLVDGGVFVNNPALVAYAEGRNIFKRPTGEDATAKDMKILSLGTGFSKKRYTYSKAKNWGKAQWIQPVIDIMMSGSVEVANYELGKIYETIENPDQYLRLDADLKGTNVEAEMDCATQENMKNLKAFGKKLFKDNKDKIENWLSL